MGWVTPDSFPAFWKVSHIQEKIHKPDKLSHFVAVSTARCVFDGTQQLLLSCKHKAQGHRPPILPLVPHTEVMVRVCAWPVKLPLRTSDGPLARYPTLTPAVKQFILWLLVDAFNKRRWKNEHDTGATLQKQKRRVSFRLHKWFWEI